MKKAELIGNILSTSFPKSNFAFEFSVKKKPYEFFLSPNGNWLTLILTNYIIDNAPDDIKERWNLYPTKSSKGDMSEFSLQISDKNISTKDLIVYYTVDKNRKKVDIEFYIEGGSDFPENLKYEILFIMLDNTISEQLVMFYIGSIDILDHKLDRESVPMSEFNVIIAQILNEEGWEESPKMDDQFAGYELKPNEDPDAPIREDIYIISAKNGAIDLYKNYLGVNEEDNNAFFSKFKESGIFYKTVAYDISTIPRDQILDLR